MNTIAKNKVAVDLRKSTTISRIINVLIKIRFFPVKTHKENYEAIFKPFGLETMTYIIIWWGKLCLVFLLPSMVFKDVSEIQGEILVKADIIEVVSMYAFSTFTVVAYPLCPIFLALALPAVSSITVARDLKWPRNRSAFVISFLLGVFGNVVTSVSNWNGASQGQHVALWSEILAVYIIPVIQFCLLISYWLIPSLVVSSLIENFMGLCKNRSTAGKVEQASV